MTQTALRKPARTTTPRHPRRHLTGCRVAGARTEPTELARAFCRALRCPSPRSQAQAEAFVRRGLGLEVIGER